MSPRNVRDTAASVHRRLLNRARAANRPFQEMLQHYAMERFLYRLSCSRYAERFVLKGALLMRVWQAPMARPTMDIDLLGGVKNDPAKQTQWRAFRRKSSLESAPAALHEVVRAVAEFLGPISEALAVDRQFVAQWQPPGPWRTR